ncbi:hypothetical protein F0562_000156 [Nyssa sinensis]|uniref:KHA domain-containing protein n=1 Tax=Nyssa sinensis TaxID=561372 RepID=A0A5J5C3I3_9ASTE|nr:hypothetical protein F0562_000156 [Nyssa sinensis]
MSFQDRDYPSRVTVSCPKKGDVGGKLVLLPQTFEELLEIGAKRYGFLPAKVLSEDGAEIDAIELIRDGDHIKFLIWPPIVSCPPIVVRFIWIQSPFQQSMQQQVIASKCCEAETEVNRPEGDCSLLWSHLQHRL